MKVYYTSSIWSRGKGLCGLPQRVNWQFEWAGTKRYIPVIYRFSKGVVFDVITILDETRLREFFDKYEAIEETLTPLQRRCVKQEYPYQDMPIREIWINGKPIESGYSSSSTLSIPWARENDDLPPVRNAYSSILKDVDCFACHRFCVAYPETDSIVQKLLRVLRLDRVNTIKLSTHPRQRFFPLDVHFEMSVGENRELCLNHPVTGATYRLYFQKPELMELPIGAGKNRALHIMHLMYEIDPALPQGDSLQFDSSIQYTEPPDDKFSPISASSIGIIGGADGPTALFISSKGQQSEPCGIHGLPLHRCLSVPSFQREDTSQFILQGINTEDYGSQEYSFGDCE